ncbi:MAG: S41 family peptidase [Chitinophagaceae bacterium]|nr:S41 family peptidase [Chitinophagaceae bacterium]
MKKRYYTFIIIAFIGVAGFIHSNDSLFEISRSLEIYANTYKEINNLYVDEINPTSIMNVGIHAMLSSLDPYTVLIPEDQIEDYRTSVTGEYGGIGVSTILIEGEHTIFSLQEGYPAEKAGLKIGDAIISVDGVLTNSLTETQLGKLLRGQSKKLFQLSIKRYGIPNNMLFQVDREKITLENVIYKDIIQSEIALIKLVEFTSGAGENVKKAIKEVKEKGAKYIILDLRNNPGGLLHEAVNISNIFLPKNSLIVETKGKQKDLQHQYGTLNTPVDTETPLIVLINDHSASASEIVAGVMQDYDRGLIIGQKSYGKGLVQITKPIIYNNQLKVTVSKYYIPSGRCIQAIDYSRKNKDKKVLKTDDSLRVPFQTKGGRTVYDGDGINPDVITAVKKYSELAYQIDSKGLILTFAIRYYYTHSTIPPALDFKLSDAEYQEFVNWYKSKKTPYRTEVEDIYQDMTASLKEEGAYISFEKELSALSQKIEEEKAKDIWKHKEEIKKIIEQRIASMYYLQKGVIETTFADDEDIQKAVELFRDIKEYNKLLGK